MILEDWGLVMTPQQEYSSRYGATRGSNLNTTEHWLDIYPPSPNWVPANEPSNL